jgi:hypothetical protein
MEENIVQEIMEEFAGRTGLLPEGAAPVRRYLWTDAFAVCNYLALYEQSGREKHLHLALGLVDQVHEILGRHRDDDPRSGWISGLDALQAGCGSARNCRNGRSGNRLMKGLNGSATANITIT